MNLDRYKIKSSNTDIETHEVFLDTMAHRKEEELGISEKKLEVPLKEKISYIMFGIFLLLALVLLFKTFYFQIFEGKKMLVSAENNKGAANLIIPERGIIYDKNLKKLVSNSPAFDLICDRAYFSVSSPEIEKEIEEIAFATGQNFVDLVNKIQNTDASQVLMAENIEHQNLLVLETKMNNLPSCTILQNTKRDYLLSEVFSQVIGYTGRINKEEYSVSQGYSINDNIGKTGLEKFYEKYLRGIPGQAKTHRTALGEKIEKEIISDPESGKNLILNIDAELQNRLYNALGESIKRVGAQKGAAVAMDPRTGAVLALISYPSYDANLFSGGISQENFNSLQNDPAQPLFNRAISARYPTGSIIKPLEAAAALQEKLISPDKKINDTGSLEIRNKNGVVVQTFGGVEPHGWVDMRRAIAVSSNIYFYTIGAGYGDQKGLGPSKIKEYLSLFGWDSKTGIDLPGEFSGIIPDPEWKKKTKGENWWYGDTYNLSIGQSDLQTTPLQVAVAYSAIANGGTLYKPQIVNKIVGVKEFEPEIIRSNFIDEENLKIIREGMKDAVYEPYGKAGSLRSVPVTVAVKTGTAEIGRKSMYNVWSGAFAPYENPEIVLVVTVEIVSGLGAVTLPIARDILTWYFSEKPNRE